MDGIAAPVLARPDGSDFDGAVDAIQFALDKLPPIGYSASVWKGTEIFRDKSPWVGWPHPGDISPCLPGKRALCKLSLWTVYCPAAAGRLPFRGRTAKKEFFFLREQCGDVYENKGPLWKKWAESGNVYENKGSYELKEGMYMKTRQLMLMLMPAAPAI